MKANGENTKHLYQSLADTFRKQILDHTWPSEGFIPSEQELCERFGASRITVRRALEELTKEGLITRRAGRGTWVSASPDQNIPWGINTESLENEHPDLITVEIHKTEHLLPDVAEAVLAPFPPGELVARFKVMRRLRQTPFAFSYVYLPGRHADQILKAISSRKDNFYFFPVLTKVTGQRATLVKESVEAVSAEGEVAEKLDVKPGAPVVLFKRVIEDEHGEVVLTSQRFQRTDINRIKIIRFNPALPNKRRTSFGTRGVLGW